MLLVLCGLSWLIAAVFAVLWLRTRHERVRQARPEPPSAEVAQAEDATLSGGVSI
jgi:hypothetical protein